MQPLYLARRSSQILGVGRGGPNGFHDSTDRVSDEVLLDGHLGIFGDVNDVATGDGECLSDFAFLLVRSSRANTS